jgi:hypothetical protein
MAIRRKGWRTLVVDERRYSWRAIGTDWGIDVVVVTEAALSKGATGQQLRFTLGYDHLRIPLAGVGVGLEQRAVVAPGVVVLAIGMRSRRYRALPVMSGKTTSAFPRTPWMSFKRARGSC